MSAGERGGGRGEGEESLYLSHYLYCWCGGGGVIMPLTLSHASCFCTTFRLFHRHRVRAVWEGGQRHTLALNEVLVGEKDPAQ